MTSLPRVRAGLLQHPLDDQVLVYDGRGDRVHLPTTACVITLLQEGGWTREGIAAELSSRLGVRTDASFLPLAIEELRAADLLEPSAEVSSALPDVTRRDLIRKVTVAGAAALLVPAIVTFTATSGYAQTGAGNLGACAHCTSNAQCTSNNCGNDSTSRACGSNKTANGGACSGGNQNSANQQCCSGTCSANPGICLA